MGLHKSPYVLRGYYVEDAKAQSREQYLRIGYYASSFGKALNTDRELVRLALA